jgi:hypothetical protein
MQSPKLKMAFFPEDYEKESYVILIRFQGVDQVIKAETKKVVASAYCYRGCSDSFPYPPHTP